MTLLTDVFARVKSDFCNLLDYRLRGNTMEIITGLVTLTRQYVSVFVSEQNGKFIISDGGWFESGYYTDKEDIEKKSQSLLDIVLPQYIERFNIKIVPNGKVNYYYKTTDQIHLISALVFDVASFINAVVNQQSLQYKEENGSENQYFMTKVNNSLKNIYQNVEPLGTLDNIPKMKGIKFSAIVRQPSSINLLMYITGANNADFIRNIGLSYQVFDLADRHYTYGKPQKIAVVNTIAEGYDPQRSASLMDSLEEKLSYPPLDFHRNFAENIKQCIPVN